MMNSKRCCLTLATLPLLGILFAAPAHAQYTTDYQTNIISGVTSNWSGQYFIGYTNEADVLLIQDDGVFSDGEGYVGSFPGHGPGGDSNVAVVSGPGSVWSNSGGLGVGVEGNYNQLVVTNGGAVYSVGGDIGEYSYNNTVLVTGSGSVWSNTGDLLLGGEGTAGNSLIIADGGMVYNNNFTSGADGNSLVLVTGSGSEWVAQNLEFNQEGGNALVITNGGVVNSSSCFVFNSAPTIVTGKGSIWYSGSIEFTGEDAGTSFTISDGGVVYSSSATLTNGFNTALVTGSGSVWNIQTSLSLLNYGALYGRLTVSNGGAVIAGDVGVGAFCFMTISGGGLYVTNGLGSGELSVGGENSLITFNGGTLASEATAIGYGSMFTVGDGTDAAMFQLASGGSGIHSFANGLTISSNAFLTGCGTIEGSAVVDPGGIVVANCGGTLTFTGIVTNNGTMQALNGSVLEGYSNLVNNGIIDIRGGTTNFHGGFINNGIVITTNNFPAITAIQLVGPDVEISVHTGNGSTYVFEETTNLTSAAWTPVIEFTGPGGIVTFIDPAAATLPQRFYRVGLIPSP
jgi:T5SS/PEP-CTERM-associated repeat protein